MSMVKGFTVVAAAFAMVLASTASAAVVDLTTEGNDGTVNGALFLQWDGQSTGTGTINSFVEVGGNSSPVSGYNTTVNGTLDNGSSDQFNHALLLTDIPVVIIDGVAYREFILDVNQTGNDPEISLDDIQVFTSDSANQSVETFTSGIVDLTGTLVYRLDAGGNNTILLDYSLNSGSGSGDMLFYVPDSVFNTGEDYVYLYSQFGATETYENNDGFEEWAVREGDVQIIVPEPTSLGLLGLGLAGLAMRRRGKRA